MTDESDPGRRRVVVTPEFIVMALKQIDSGVDIPGDAELIDLRHTEETWSYTALVESDEWSGGNREGAYVPRLGEGPDEIEAKYEDNADE